MPVLKVKDPADPSGATWISLPAVGPTGPTGAPTPPAIAVTATLNAGWSGAVKYHVGVSSVTVIVNGLAHAGNLAASGWYQICATPVGVPPPPSTISVQVVTHTSNHTANNPVVVEIRSDGIYLAPWTAGADYSAGMLVNFGETWNAQ